MAPRLRSTICLRLPTRTIRRADKALRIDRDSFARRASRDFPYRTTRSDILRAAIEIGLDALIHHGPNP